MATLHTVNKSPFERNALDACLRFARDGAGVLLIEDGVLAAARGNRCAEAIASAMQSVCFYALRPDLQARGLNEDRLIDGIRVVDYDGFVELSVEYARVQSWL